MVQEAVEPQVRAWALEQTETRSVRRFVVEAFGRLLADDLEQTETCLELALQALKRARAAHTGWAGK